MVVVQNFDVICHKFNVVGICTSGNCAQNGHYIV